MGLSAKRLGEKIGLTAEQTNTLLKESGFQEGSSGDYNVTEKGKKYVEEKSWDNGYGGWAARGYSYNEWDESIINELDTSSENLQKMRDLTSQRRKKKKNNKCNTQYNEKNNYDDNNYEHKTDYSINESTDSTEEDIGAGIGLIIAAGLFLYGVGKGIYEKRKEKKSKELSVKKKSLKERLFKKLKNNE